MIYKLIVKQEALIDIYEIADWYNSKKKNLGELF